MKREEIAEYLVMKLQLKFLLSLLMGSAVYTCLEIFVGSNGIYAYNQLEAQKKEIAYKTNEIEKINSELNLEYVSLQKDNEVIAAYARRLGYVLDGETIVKINGLKPYQKKLWDIGTVTRHKNAKSMNESTCKILGLVFFLLMFITLALIGSGSGKKVQRRRIKKQEVKVDKDIDISDDGASRMF